MNYLRLLLFFFVLLAPLQLTSADPSDPCVNQYNECYDAAQPWADAIADCNAKFSACSARQWSHFDDDNGDNHDDDHGDNHSDDDGNEYNQETPPRLLQDIFVWFQG